MSDKRLFFLAAALILLLCSSSFAEEKTKEAFSFKQKNNISSARPNKPARKPVKVKLRRLSDGTYTWEISGDDLAEIIKTDKRLRDTYEAKSGEMGSASDGTGSAGDEAGATQGETK